MKLFDFWLQFFTLITYIVISPFVFGLLFPTTGDVLLIWIWVVVVAGITSILSMITFIILNVFVDPARTYKMKGLIPLGFSSILMYNIGSELSDEMEVNFIYGNIFLLVTVYVINGIVFFKKFKSPLNKK